MKTKFAYGLALLGLLGVPLPNVQAQELVPARGEIRLDGSVRSVDVRASTLILDATSFTLPNGKTSGFTTPKPKTVEISKTTQIHVRGNMSRKIPLSDLKSGVFLIAVGADAGAGKNLPAREIAVWERVTNGKYEFGAPKAPAPVTAPPVTTPPAPAPPATAPPVTAPPVIAPPVIAPPVTIAPPLNPAAPPQPRPVPAAVPQDVVLANGGVVTPATTVADGPLLTVRVKTGSPAAPTDLNLAPGVALPPALAKLTKAPHIFTVALETADAAPQNATATLTMPAGLKRPSPSELRIIQPREPVRGMVRPFTASIYWGSGKTLATGQPKESELDAITLGYYTHQRKPPEKYSGAASVAIGPRVAPEANGTAPTAPPADASAVGDYTLQTSYAGAARFQISAEQDFLEPLKLDLPKDKIDFSQPLNLQWQPVPRAVGYRFKAIGSRTKATGPGREVIVWTSSAVAPGDAQDEQVFDDPARAVREGLLLPSTATSCTIPAGVLKGMATVAVVAEAYGPGQTTRGNPAVRIVVQSENVFSLTSSDAEAIAEAEAAARPRPRPRPQELPSLFTGEAKAWVRITTHLNSSAWMNQPAPSTAVDARNTAAYRYFTVNLAAKEPAQEQMAASISVPDGLYAAGTGALPLRMQAPPRSQISTTPRDAFVYWGSGDAAPQGQPVAQIITYDDQSALTFSTSRASYSGAGSVAVGPYTQPNAIMRVNPKGTAVGPYTLQTSYAGKVDFTVEEQSDFLFPVRAWFTSEAADFTKPVTIHWHPVARALGYRVTLVATRPDRTKGDGTVIWSAARTQPADARLLTSALEDVAAAVNRGEVLSPDASSVTLPPGIFADTRDVRVRIEALGPTIITPSTPTSPAVQITTNSVTTLSLTKPPAP